MLNSLYPNKEISRRTLSLVLGLLLAVLMLLSVISCSREDVPPKDAISASEAEQIALDHAGLRVADVTRQRTEYDYDDGVPEYEVEFRQGSVEYDYVIHAISGEILHHEQERGD